jgi:hypothetical protein
MLAPDAAREPSCRVGESAPEMEGAAAAKLLVLAIIIVSISTAALSRVLPSARLWVEVPRLLIG